MDRKLKIALILAAVCMASVTLGIGLSAGYTVAGQFLRPSYVLYEVERMSVTTVRVNPIVVPLDPSQYDFVDVISRVKDAVVSISIGVLTGVRDDIGSGSGFIFSQNEELVFIATNNHVIDGAERISVSLDDNESVPAFVLSTNRELDLAVLVVKLDELIEKGLPFTALTFGDSDLMRIGDTVVAMGNAMGEGQTVTLGIISALDLDIVINEPRASRLELNVLQTDAAVNRGNSGGPLINSSGEVVGIVTAKQIGSGIEGMGYALPSNNVVDILNEMKETPFTMPPFIGVEFSVITPFEESLFNLPSTGMLIQNVIADSPAEEAGILEHDLVVSVGDIYITSQSDVARMLSSIRPGDEVVFGIYRDGERIEILVVIGVRS